MKPLYLSLIFFSCLASCGSREKKAADAKTTAADTPTTDSPATATSAADLPKNPDSLNEPAQAKDTQTGFQHYGKIAIFSEKDGITVPPYGLEKVKTLTAGIRAEEDTSGEGATEILDQKNYSSLSFKEKFTYHMIHPETYSQNCDGFPVRPEEDNRIYGHLPAIFGENSWSERQLGFFKNHRDSVEDLMKTLITKNNAVGGNFREAIVEMKGKEMIPFLIDAYKNNRKDHYILTTLMLLMKDYQYPEFVKSSSFKKLYGAGGYSSFLIYNQANEDLILKRATDFYNASSKK